MVEFFPCTFLVQMPDIQQQQGWIAMVIKDQLTEEGLDGR